MNRNKITGCAKQYKQDAQSSTNRMRKAVQTGCAKQYKQDAQSSTKLEPILNEDN